MTEATRDAEILEVLRENKQVMEGTKAESITPLKDGDLPLGTDDSMGLKTVSSAGIIYVWDTKTFEKIPILYYMANQKMKEKRADGSYRFTARQPEGKPWKGTVKCRLHKEDPDRTYYDTLGLRYCTKSNLSNVYERDRHMKMKHPKEWESIEQARIARERQEDRDLQRLVLASAARTPEAPVVTVVETSATDRINDPLYQKRVENMARARAAKKK
uniref:Uncharacterized protein n=1 Tax=viral metagenome TaxID=1070528 RepID=A0A6M3J8Q8_9ZZZZ